MKPAAIVGALIGGIIGAILWGAISAVINFEIGYMATGIGFLVGFGAVLLGGQGKPMGVLCGIIALLSIFGGKIAAVRFTARPALRAELLKEGVPESQVDARADEAMQHVDFALLFQSAKDDLDPIDIVFAVIGIGAAYQIGSGSRSRATQPAGSYSQGQPTSGVPPQAGVPQAVPMAPPAPIEPLPAQHAPTEGPVEPPPPSST